MGIVGVQLTRKIGQNLNDMCCQSYGMEAQIVGHNGPKCLTSLYTKW